MRILLSLFSVVYFVNVCHGQAITQEFFTSIVSLIEQEKYKQSYEKIEQNKQIYIEEADSVRADVLYLKGLSLLGMGCKREAISNFEESCSFAERSSYYTTSYLDTLLRLLVYNNENQKWRQSALLGKKFSKIDKKILSDSPFCSHIFLQWSIALMNLNRFHEIPSICKEGLSYADYRDSDYFFLSYNEATSLNEIGQHDSARIIFDKLIVRGIHSQEEEWVGIDGLQSAMSYNRIPTDSLIHSISSGYIGGSISHNHDSICQSIRTIMDSYINFGVYTLEEEKELFGCLLFLQSANYLGFVSVETKYDNILYSKSFINWKTSKNYQTKCNWMDVKNALSFDEIAIEVSTSTSELLLIRSDFERPVSIPIDTIIHSTILQYDMKDPMCINSLYEGLSPLSALWNSITPYLNGIATIFLSPSDNIIDGNSNYCAINYGAIIADKDGGRVSDKYEIRIVSSTADIDDSKDRTITLRDALIYGGIDYNSSINTDVPLLKKQVCNDSNLLSNDSCELRGGSFVFLNGTKKEANLIDSILTTHNVKTKVLSGRNATEETFKKIDKRSPNIIHVASHGYLIPYASDVNLNLSIAKFPNLDLNNQYKASLTNTGLLLSGANATWSAMKSLNGIEDGVLTSQEIANLDLTNTSLVVLSACESGLGDTNNLSGTIYGLQHAFRLAGAGYIVSSLWKVDDFATHLFMKFFYTHLMNGENIHTAIKRAQLELISSGYKDPYYWAAFIVLC